MSRINIAGCCACCGCKIYHIVRQYPDDHPYAGVPRQVGDPSENCRKLHLILTNANTCPVTVCVECCDGVRLPDLWETLLRSWALELQPEHRRLIGAKALTPKQLEVSKKWLASMTAIRPLGILTMERPSNG